MNRTMISSAVSLAALQQKLDMIANNIANMNTDGYKRQEASFQDVLTSKLSQHPDTNHPARATTPGLMVGGGARLHGLTLDLTQGALKETGRSLDFAIEGQALFEIEIPLFNAEDEPVLVEDGQVFETAWTRSGSFQFSVLDDGYKMLTTAEGYPVLLDNDQYVIVPGDSDIQVDETGLVTYTDEEGMIQEAGRLKLMRVLRPDYIELVGNNMYRLSAAVQDQDNVLEMVNFEDPAQRGIAVRQHYVEQSNVDLTTEMTELIMVQRAYQLNARALMAGDTMMNLANQLRR